MSRTTRRLSTSGPGDGTDGEDDRAHGVFDSRAKPRPLQLWASHHHGVTMAIARATATRVLVR